MTLSKRLQKIDQMVTKPYQHIWDCCCDHGLLGISLLTRQAAPKIHFVDIVEEIIEPLEIKLQQFFSHSPCHWKTHCLDVKKLPLKQYQCKNSSEHQCKNQRGSDSQSDDKAKHLVIIAGIGGDLMTDLVEGIYQQNPDISIDFLLCPVHHQFTLRQQLITRNFSLLDEELIEENGRFYEILLVSTNTLEGKQINPVGDKIWQGDTAEQSHTVQKYLTKTLNHYQRIQLNNGANVQHIISAYQAKRQ